MILCPECGSRMWRYEGDQYRCRNDHVFEQTAIEGVQARVVRVDRPSRWDRLQDVLVGAVTATGLYTLVIILLDRV